MCRFLWLYCDQSEVAIVHSHCNAFKKIQCISGRQSCNIHRTTGKSTFAFRLPAMCVDWASLQQSTTSLSRTHNGWTTCPSLALAWPVLSGNSIRSKPSEARLAWKIAARATWSTSRRRSPITSFRIDRISTNQTKTRNQTLESWGPWIPATSLSWLRVRRISVFVFNFETEEYMFWVKICKCSQGISPNVDRGTSMYIHADSPNLEANTSPSISHFSSSQD